MQGDGNRTSADEAERNGVAFVGRQRHHGGQPGRHVRGLAERAEQAEHQAVRLEEAVRGGFAQADHLLQHRTGQAEHE